uniref:Beta-lactamase-related domain-containing protein n=1 Tax=Mycena chlorophos TaxID=658473 RepID=A0ABQ0M6T8_MYCCL|nr:predicted protein [Mycena chlorophos]
MRTSRIWIVFSLLAAKATARSQQVPLSLSQLRDRIVDAELYTRIEDKFRALNVAGASLAIVWSDETRPVEYTTWGKRDEGGTPVTSDTIFNIASCSKAFLSASLGILMQDFADEKNTTVLPSTITCFGWDTKLRDLLPEEWLLDDEWATEKAGVRDLLAHRTGLPAHDLSYSPYDSPADVVAKMRHLRAANELRAQYEYTNLMYIAGAHIISKYSGNTTVLPSTITRFGWDTKLRDLLPEEWLLEDEWATEKADLKDLLSHRTGLPTHDLSYSPYDSPADVVAKMRHLRAANELRAQYEYTNLMYIAGAHIISKYSGLDYRDFVAKRIFEPLGMSSSMLYPAEAAATGRLTQAWSPVSGRRIRFFMPENSAPLIAGAGGVQSTVEDMSRWLRTVLNHGVDPRTNQTIISKSTFDLATSAISVLSETGNPFASIMGYGMGWIRFSYRGHDSLSHSGGAPGVGTRVEVYPDDGFGIVLLTNTAAQEGSRTIPPMIVDRVLGLSKMYDHPEPGVTTTDAKLDDTDLAVAHRPLKDLAGAYTNPGYGNFTLCSPLFSKSKACKDVVEDFATVDGPDHLPTHVVSLYAKWERVWGTHVRLTPVLLEGAGGAGVYKVEMTTLYPRGYGMDTSPFEDPGDELVARFVFGDERVGKVLGLGLFGVAQGETLRARKGGSVQEMADVWFEKVSDGHYGDEL